MDWIDEAIVLSARAHGESSAVLELLTEQHGRHMGLVRGGASHRMKPVLLAGNSLKVEWRARLSEHLGSFTVELTRARAGAIMEGRAALTGLNAATAILSATLPERAPYTDIYAATGLLFDALSEDGLEHWGALYARWEIGILEALGHGLDLSECAATGTTEDLIYVSPRSGRAVCRAAGAPYAARMFTLPPFLLGSQNAIEGGDVAAALRLSAHFIAERLLIPHGKTLPVARMRLESLAESYKPGA